MGPHLKGLYSGSEQSISGRAGGPGKELRYGEDGGGLLALGGAPVYCRRVDPAHGSGDGIPLGLSLPADLIMEEIGTNVERGGRGARSGLKLFARGELDRRRRRIREPVC